MENTNQSKVSSISMPDSTVIQQAVHQMVLGRKRSQQVLLASTPSIYSIEAIGKALLQPELASFYTDLSSYGERALNKACLRCHSVFIGSLGIQGNESCMRMRTLNAGDVWRQ